MAENKSTPNSNRGQMPPPPPLPNTGTLARKNDGTPDPEVGGHMDRTQEPTDEQKAGPGLGVKVSNLVTGEQDPALTGEVMAPLPPSSGIAVIATRDGVYDQVRLKDGDRFNIRKEEDFGSWMRLADDKAEKARAQKAAKAKAKLAEKEQAEEKKELVSKKELAGF